jgi:hypothetical protein
MGLDIIAKKKGVDFWIGRNFDMLQAGEVTEQLANTLIGEISEEMLEVRSDLALLLAEFVRGKYDPTDDPWKVKWDEALESLKDAAQKMRILQLVFSLLGDGWKVMVQ